MKIREFHSKFSSGDVSFLFEILRKLSLLEEVAGFAETVGWATWPPDSGPATGPGLVAAGA